MVDYQDPNCDLAHNELESQLFLQRREDRRARVAIVGSPVQSEIKRPLYAGQIDNGTL